MEGGPPYREYRFVVIDNPEYDRHRTYAVPLVVHGGQGGPTPMNRRAFLRTTALTSVAASFARLPNVWAGSTADNRWRAFEVTTRVEILTPSSVTRAWVPLPLAEDTDYHRTLGRTWNGNAASVQAVRDSRYGAGFVVA